MHSIRVPHQDAIAESLRNVSRRDALEDSARSKGMMAEASQYFTNPLPGRRAGHPGDWYPAELWAPAARLQTAPR